MIQVNKCDNEGNYSETIKQNFFGECEYVIDRLHNERVCVIGYNEKDNQFWIGESCDDWYADDLSTEDCKNLAEMFNKMADMMEKGK